MTSPGTFLPRLVAAILGLTLAASPCWAKPKPAPKAPAQETPAQPGATGPAKSSAAACASIAKGMDARIEGMKALKEEMASAGAPEAKLFQDKDPLPAFTHVPGDPERRLADERKSLEQLNAMLQSLGCAPVDIDYQLAQPAKENKKASQKKKFEVPGAH